MRDEESRLGLNPPISVRLSAAGTTPPVMRADPRRRRAMAGGIWPQLVR